jgi:Spy/CpxP family protein refolding chaperone
MKSTKALFVATAFIVGGAFAAQAAHKDVKHCADDYRKFCHQWGLETKGLENCMRKHGDKLTNACVAALVKAGEVSQAEVNRRKKQLGR